MNFELKQLSPNDGRDCYILLQNIGEKENDFTNPVHNMSYKQFKDWLEEQDGWSHGENLPEGYVPQYCYWLYVDEKPVGFGKIRLGLTPQSRIEGGNIGCAIDPVHRGKGYATYFIALLLQKAQEMEIGEILITVKKYNYPSKVACEKNGCKVFKETECWWYLTK